MPRKIRPEKVRSDARRNGAQQERPGAAGRPIEEQPTARPEGAPKPQPPFDRPSKMDVKTKAPAEAEADARMGKGAKAKGPVE
jgi:hypothetical protein